jgi:hypothetical protein
MNAIELLKFRDSLFLSKKNKFLENLKESMYGVLYVLLKDDNTPEFIQILLIMIEFFEFLTFPFTPVVSGSWGNNSITKFLFDMTSKANIVSYLYGGSPLVFFTVFYINVSAFILIILNIAYVSYSFSRKYFTVTWPLYVLRSVAKIYITILFEPVFELFLSVFSCYPQGSAVLPPSSLVPNNSNSTIYVNLVSPDYVCFNWAHYIHMAVSFIVILLLLITGLIVGMSFYDSSEVSDDSTAK